MICVVFMFLCSVLLGDSTSTIANINFKIAALDERMAKVDATNVERITVVKIR